jgi:hypothetical protein
LLIALAASAIHILRVGTRAGDPHRRTLASPTASARS